VAILYNVQARRSADTHNSPWTNLQYLANGNVVCPVALLRQSGKTTTQTTTIITTANNSNGNSSNGSLVTTIATNHSDSFGNGDQNNMVPGGGQVVKNVTTQPSPNSGKILKKLCPRLNRYYCETTLTVGAVQEASFGLNLRPRPGFTVKPDSKSVVVQAASKVW